MAATIHFAKAYASQLLGDSRVAVEVITLLCE